MDVVDLVRRIDMIAEQVKVSAHECATKTVAVTWECPRGKRAEDRTAELVDIARGISEDLLEISALLRVQLAGN